jgi:hypothetical protein
MTFDTLSYARRLKQAGVPEAQAEAMADATRELVVTDIASKADVAALKTELKADIAAVKAEVAAVKVDVAAVEQRVMAAMETLGLRLTVRLGGLIAVGIAVLAAVIKL